MLISLLLRPQLGRPGVGLVAAEGVEGHCVDGVHSLGWTCVVVVEGTDTAAADSG